MRLLADENVAPFVIATLRESGHDVVAIRDVARGATDARVISIARRARRVILTHDRDFGNLIRYPVRLHAGVLLMRLRDQSPAAVARVLTRVLARLSERKLRNHLAVLNEYEVRLYPDR